MEIIEAIYDARPLATEHDVIASNINRNRHPQMRESVDSQLYSFRQAKDEHLMTTPGYDGQNPLHIALQMNAKLVSIKLLVKGNPLVLQSTNNGGRLPLHFACMDHDSVSVVQYLVELDTTTLEAVDHENDTALHYACFGAKFETIALLLEEYDAVSVSKRNAEEKLPIDVLWESNDVVDREGVEYTESVFRLLRAYPATMMNTSTTGA